MMADLRQYTELNIYMVEGDTLNATNATFTDDDSTDYSGYDSGQCLLKKRPTDADADAVIDINTTDGTLVLSNGSFYFDCAPSVTDEKKGTYWYGVKIKSGTDEYTIMKGIWNIAPKSAN